MILLSSSNPASSSRCKWANEWAIEQDVQAYDNVFLGSLIMLLCLFPSPLNAYIIWCLLSSAHSSQFIPSVWP